MTEALRRLRKSFDRLFTTSAYDPKSGMYKGKGTGVNGRKVPRDGALSIARPVDPSGRIRKDVG